MEKEFKDILSDERHKRRATQRQMADQLGISEKMYSQYESGKYLGGPTKVSKYLDKLYGKKIAQDTDIDAIDLHKNEGVPVYDIEFSAGFLEQFRDKKPEIITYINMPEVQGCDYVIRAKGDSMADYINNMDWIQIKKIEDKEVIAYGQAYAIVTRDMQLIKYIRKGTKDTYLLKSQNANFDDFELPIKKVIELYLVKTVLKIKTLI